MKKIVCYLVLDYDGVLVPAEELYDKMLYESICKKASNIYLDEQVALRNELEKIKLDLERERSGSKRIEDIKKELENVDRRINYHYRVRDYVLEEKLPQYVNKIPYHELYTVKNVFPGVLELVHKLYDMGIYVEIIVCSHVNVESEIRAKKILLDKEFPPVKFVPVQFYLERILTGNVTERVRSNKPERLLETLPYLKDYINYILMVDNSRSVLTEADELGFKCFFVRENDDKFIIENPVLNPIPAQVILDVGQYTLENIYGEKKKKLIL